MAFSKLLQHEVNIYRLTSGVGVQKTYQLVAGNVKAFVQPLTAEQNALHGLAMGKGFKCFIDPIGAQAGDKVVFTAANEEYRVQGVEEYAFTQVKNPHEMLIMVQEDS